MSLLVLEYVLLLASVSCWYLSCCRHQFCFLVFSLLPACFCFHSWCYCHSCWCWRPSWSWCSFFPAGILKKNEIIGYPIQKTISYGLRPQSVGWSQKSIACSLLSSPQKSLFTKAVNQWCFVGSRSDKSTDKGLEKGMKIRNWTGRDWSGRMWRDYCIVFSSLI